MDGGIKCELRGARRSQPSRKNFTRLGTDVLADEPSLISHTSMMTIIWRFGNDNKKGRVLLVSSRPFA